MGQMNSCKSADDSKLTQNKSFDQIKWKEQIMFDSSKYPNYIYSLGCSNKNCEEYYLYFTGDPECWYWRKVKGNQQIMFKFQGGDSARIRSCQQSKPVCGHESVLCKQCFKKLGEWRARGMGNGSYTPENLQ